MAKGQAERLMPMLQASLAETGCAWKDVAAIAVGVGPGNFTGVRIAVSAARGLALGLGIPGIGVSAFETMRDPEALGAHPVEIVSLEAPRGQAYVQAFRNGVPQGSPRLIDPDAPPADLELPGNMRVSGFRAITIARAFNATSEEASLKDVASRIGAVALWRLARGETPDRPAVLYVRAADALPPSDPPPVTLP